MSASHEYDWFAMMLARRYYEAIKREREREKYVEYTFSISICKYFSYFLYMKKKCAHASISWMPFDTKLNRILVVAAIFVSFVR